MEKFFWRDHDYSRSHERSVTTHIILTILKKYIWLLCKHLEKDRKRKKIIDFY